MLFSRAVSFFAFVSTLGTFALAKVDGGIEKRGEEASIEKVFTTLKSTTDVVLPEIKSQAVSGNATEGSVGPLVNELVLALTKAKVSLDSVGPTTLSDNSSIPGTVSGLIEEIVDALDSLLGSVSTNSGILSGVDVALSEVLLGLGVVLDGVLNLVSSLVSSLTGALGALGLGGTLSALNL